MPIILGQIESRLSESGHPISVFGGDKDYPKGYPTMPRHAAGHPEIKTIVKAIQPCRATPQACWRTWFQGSVCRIAEMLGIERELHVAAFARFVCCALAALEGVLLDMVFA